MTTQTLLDPNQKLSVKEKVGYSLGDLAANLIFQTLMTFLAFFYTDVYNLPPATAAMIIFAGGVLGSFFNPIMGIIADRTQTRWGKFRPWILWTSVPFGLVALLAFSTPDLGEQGKVIYALTTYILLVMIYSANNLPYSALSGVLTGNMAERNSLSSYRFVAVMVAQFVIQALLLPLVLIMGEGDKAVGFQKVMTLFAIVGTVFFIITFLTTKERVIPAPEQRSSIMQDLTDLVKNKPWVVMLCLTILVFVTLSLKGGMYIFYFQNYADTAAMAAFLQNIGFIGFIDGLNAGLVSMGFTEFAWPEDPATSTFSLFNASGIIFMIVGIGFSKMFADKYGKRNAFCVALTLATLFMLAFFFFDKTSIGSMFTSQILHGFFYGITTPLLWAMIADVADYSEWKNNRRATAIIFSAMIFGLKMGLSIGGALVAGLLSVYGYDSSAVVQNAETIEGIRISMSIYASLPFLLGVGLMYFYEINKSMESRIEKDLITRRQAQ
jgi:GPH family glycoside/pentoside/hexuronide:cation symporter